MTEILAVVDNVIRLHRPTMGPSLLSTLQADLVRTNPQYQMMRVLAEKNPQKFRHAKMPPSTISSIDVTDDTVMLPRGYRSLLERHVAEAGQTINWIDKRSHFDRDPSMRLGNVTLKDYQDRALSAFILGGNGVVVAPCGAGKTVTGIALTTALAQPTLIMVHTNDLMDQWQRELADKAVLPGGVGQWGAGVKVRGKVTIGMIQTLVRMPTKDLVEFLDHFGCVILDECHHAPADTFLQLMNLCKARYRFGLTATHKRKDGLEFLMHDVIGPVLTEVTDSELEAEGRMQPCEVVDVPTNFYTRFTADDWTHLIKELVSDDGRNRLIVSTVIQSWNDGYFPLILSDRVGHCKWICEQLRAAGMNAQLMTGDVPKQVRVNTAEAARNNLVDAIVATKVADEGLDIPNLSAIHLTCPSANEGKIKQRVGRIRRPLEGKPVSRVYDYRDHKVPSSVRMARERHRMYKRWGFGTAVASRA